MKIEAELRSLYHAAYRDGEKGVIKAERITMAVQAIIGMLPEEHPDSWQGNQPQIEYELGRRQYRKEVLRMLRPKE